MEDKELILLAAKAVGLDALGWWDDTAGCLKYPHRSDLTDSHLWNPLADDGDALRLAVRLNIYVWCIGDTDTSIADDVSEKHIGQDRYQATRRAIVRAAAEVAGEVDTGSITD